MYGKLITLSGIDGSGKSSIGQGLSTYFNNKFKVKFVSGFEIRNFTNELSVLADNSKHKIPESLLNIAWLCDLANTVSKLIIPELKSNNLVIVDRYYLCAKAYSMATTNYNIEDLFYLYNSLPKPDLCLYYDINPELSMDRIIKRGESRVYYENVTDLIKIQNMYQRLIPYEDYPIVSVNAEDSFENVLKRTVTLIEQFVLDVIH